MENKKFILKISCEDRPGIVATITTSLFELGCNLAVLDQYSDTSTGQFFMRVVAEGDITKETLKTSLDPVFKKFNIDGHIYDHHEKPKVLIMCSKQSHCLNHILHRHADGSLKIDIPLIISNHSDLEEMASWYKIPFLHLTITPENKEAQEAEIAKLIEKHDIDYVVLARYMQIISPKMCEMYKGRIINIHHSFLPGFKGANPYRQAFERGVKMIGATAHFVTSDLDEGPIICQETIRVNHAHTVQDLTRHGADIESLVLSRAIKYVAERRVFIDKNKTVVLK